MRYKNIYTILLVALFSLMGETLRAYDFEYTYEGKTLYYNINTAATNEVSVTYKASYLSCHVSGDVKIPSEVTYNGTTYSVTEISEEAFNYCDITSIEIPSTVTTIGDNVFVNCTKLTSLTIPASVTNIGKKITNSCTNLTSIVVDSSNPKYDSRDNCNAIVESSTNTILITCKNTTIPTTVTSIGDFAFYSRSDLTSIVIPASITSIGKGAFYSCKKLTSVEILAPITVINDSTFTLCSKLTNINIPSSVTSIGEHAFNRCGFTTIEIPSSVTKIGNSAFYKCDIKNIEIPSSVISVGDYAFERCGKLTDVKISSSVTEIGQGVFNYCYNLSNIVVDPENTKYDSRNDCNAIIETATNTLIAGSGNTIIPSSVTSIGTSAFFYRSCLKNIVIPSSVTSIGSAAFSFCGSLDTMVCLGIIPPTIVNSQSLNGNVLLVPCEAVSNYQNDTYFSTQFGSNIVGSQQREITDTICVGETYDFYGTTINQSGVYFHTISATSGSCDSLITLNLFVKPNFSDTINKVIYEGDTLAFNGTNLTTEGTYVANLQTTSGCDSIITLNLLTIPRDTVTLIQIDTIRDTLYENNKLYYTVIYHTLTSSYTAEVTYKSKGENYISGDVVIPSEVNIGGVNYTVTSIGGNAFQNCSGLTSVVLPSSITSIGNHAFNNCTNLTSINIPDSVNYIGQSAFQNCKSLTSINIPSLINMIANSVFNGAGLTSIDIPSTITSIGLDAFNGTNLTTLTIPSSVTNIQQSAFSNCKYLTSVEISSNIVQIGRNSFAFCENLTNISVATGNVYDSRDNCNAIIDNTNTLIVGCKNTTIPSTATTIAYNAFLGCSGLRSITIPASVTSIKNWAFDACDNLDTMICEGVTPPTITNNSTLVGSVLFVPCEAIEAYKNDTYFSSHFGSNIFSLDTITKTIDGTICENETYDFNGKTLSTSGTYYFTEKNTKGCDSTTILNLVVTPTYDNTINQSIFVGDTFYYNTSALTTTGTYSYPYTTINGCDSLVTINLTTFEKDTVINIQYDTLIDTLYKNNKLYFDITSPTTAEVTYKSNGENYISGDVVIPSEVVIKGNTYTVTSISSKAFMNCFGLTSVEIPSSVTEIGYMAFANCSSLTDVITSSVTNINANAFENCSNLTSIILPSTLTEIGNYAFKDCRNLTDITIPSSVTSLGANIFNGCNNLTDISVETGNAVYDSRNNCNAIVETSTNTLVMGCKTTIIPSTITKIGEYAFRDCINLGKSITIPSSVTEMGENIFMGCDNLDTMICEGTTPPTLTNKSSLKGKVLLVPCSAIDAYKNDTYFSQMFGNNIFSIDTLSITLNDTICENSTYTFGGEILSNAGTYISNEPNTNGCYTTTTLNLVVNPTYDNTINQSIFVGDTFYYNNNALTTTGTYSYPYTTVNGCDSLVIVNLNTFSRDTITKIQIDTVRDTLINDLHDTTIVIDTFITIDTINTRDTLTLTNFIHDTTIVVDTFIINTYDTTTLIDTFIVDNYDTIIIHDTIIKTIIDTITNTVIDTITEVVHDTITPCAKVYTYIFATVVRGETYTDFGFNLSEEGTYIDTLTTAEGCDSIIVLSLSLAEVIDNNQPAQIKLFPNPTSDKVYLDLINLPNADITITNIKGEVSKQYDIPQDINEVVLDISDLPTGVYSVVISNDKTKLSKKIIKK